MSERIERSSIKPPCPATLPIPCVVSATYSPLKETSPNYRLNRLSHLGAPLSSFWNSLVPQLPKHSYLQVLFLTLWLLLSYLLIFVDSFSAFLHLNYSAHQISICHFPYLIVPIHIVISTTYMLTMSKFISLVMTFYIALDLYFPISIGRFHVCRKVNIAQTEFPVCPYA